MSSPDQRASFLEVSTLEVFHNPERPHWSWQVIDANGVMLDSGNLTIPSMPGEPVPVGARPVEIRPAQQAGRVATIERPATVLPSPARSATASQSTPVPSRPARGDQSNRPRSAHTQSAPAARRDPQPSPAQGRGR